MSRAEEIALCQEWLAYQRRLLHPNRRRKIGSYKLKRIVEKWAGMYISDSVMREALERSGFVYDVPLSGVPYYNIASKLCNPPPPPLHLIITGDYGNITETGNPATI